MELTAQKQLAYRGIMHQPRFSSLFCQRSCLQSQQSALCCL